MFETIKDFIARLRVRLGALAVVFLAALPDILDALGVIDLKAVLGPWIGEQKATMILIALAFMKPMFHVVPKESK